MEKKKKNEKNENKNEKKNEKKEKKKKKKKNVEGERKKEKKKKKKKRKKKLFISFSYTENKLVRIPTACQYEKHYDVVLMQPMPQPTNQRVSYLIVTQHTRKPMHRYQPSNTKTIEDKKIK